MTIVSHPRSDGSPPPLAPPVAGAPLDRATLELVRRSAVHPDGLALLERGQLECVAVLLGVHPRDVERARVALDAPGARTAAAEAAAKVGAEGGALPALAGRPAPESVPRAPEGVLREAERRGGGLELLASSAPECAAIVFGVTPAVVLAARELLARRGIRPGTAE